MLDEVSGEPSPQGLGVKPPALPALRDRKLSEILPMFFEFASF